MYHIRSKMLLCCENAVVAFIACIMLVHDLFYYRLEEKLESLERSIQPSSPQHHEVFSRG
jgi:hypothetical protein